MLSHQSHAFTWSWPSRIARLALPESADRSASTEAPLLSRFSERSGGRWPTGAPRFVPAPCRDASPCPRGRERAPVDRGALDPGVAGEARPRMRVSPGQAEIAVRERERSYLLGRRSSVHPDRRGGIRRRRAGAAARRAGPALGRLGGAESGCSSSRGASDVVQMDRGDSSRAVRCGRLPGKGSLNLSGEVCLVETHSHLPDLHCSRLPSTRPEISTGPIGEKVAGSRREGSRPDSGPAVAAGCRSLR